MDSALRILPVFLVTGAGFVGKRLGFLPETFQGPANRLIYYFAIPCLIFLKVRQAPFSEILRPSWIVVTVGAIFLVWVASIVVSALLKLEPRSRGTFIQASIHSNLGYIGLAAAYYGLGERGVQVASIFAPFFMMTNNFLSVTAMSRYSGTTHTFPQLIKALIIHPIILSAFAAMLCAFAGIELPGVVNEAMGILAGMALPLALLLIGAGLDTEALGRARIAGVSTVTKTLLLPALGTIFLTVAGAEGIDRAAAVLLMSAPSATITMILAREMGGDPPLASSAVTLSTIVSIGTLTFWLGLLG